MDKTSLPPIRLDAKPKGLSFRAPKSALERWDKSIQAKGKTEGAIDIMGEIGDPAWGGVSAGMVKEALAVVGKGPVRVTLNSPGGDAFEGIAIYNLLRDHPGKVTVNVVGLAASAASVVAMSGDRIEMGEASHMMIHSAWGFVMGNRNDMLEFAEVLDSLDSSVAELYARRSRKPLADVLAMMQKETWMSAAEAVKHGFADVAVSEEKKEKALAFRSSISLVGATSAKIPSALLAASGDRQRPVVHLLAHAPGASGQPAAPIPKDKPMRTVAEQIASFEAKRAANLARMTEIQNKAIEEGRSKDEKEKQEFDTLVQDNETIDSELVDLRAMEKQILSSAKPITSATGQDPDAASKARAHSGITHVKPNVEPGIAYARYTQAMMRAKHDPARAYQIATSMESWAQSTPQVANALKMATVTGADTTTAGWAAELVYNQNLASEFIEYLRPKTIIGRISGLTRVPFNIRIPGESGSPTGYWVGQGAPIPVSKSTTMSITMGMAKAAGMCVLTKELIMSSSPSAELMIRNSLAKTIIQFLDVQFIAPDYAEVANVSPASITNDVVPTAPTGTNAAALRTDVQTLFNTWITNNVDPSGAVWVMTGQQSLAISLMLNALSQPYFPTVTADGGTFFGYPVVVSQSAMAVGSPVTGEGRLMVLLNAPDILLADDGEVVIDASGEASVQMLDNPTNNAQSGTPTTMVSMWQTDSVAVRAIRHINWRKRRSTAVSYIKDAAYVS